MQCNAYSFESIKLFPLKNALIFFIKGRGFYGVVGEKDI